MNRDATQKLRLDRRLIRRRGWISRAELDQELAALPDVSDKIASAEEEPGEEATSPGAGAPEAETPRVE